MLGQYQNESYFFLFNAINNGKFFKCDFLDFSILVTKFGDILGMIACRNTEILNTIR